MPLISPEVSLISSWHVPLVEPATHGPTPPSLAALQIGLQNRILFHDLYFLGHTDIQWYKGQCDPSRSFPDQALKSPVAFAADLTLDDLKRIAAALNRLLAENFGGTLVGPRPRFVALATYWPCISLPEAEGGELRKQSIQAVRNSLLLASFLGCRHVEVVAGSAVPEADCRRATEKKAGAYRSSRLATLAESLQEVFINVNAEDREKEQSLNTLLDQGTLPYLCLEIEPGKNYLINSARQFLEFYDGAITGGRYGHILDRYLLFNADIAHLILAGSDPEMELEGLRTICERDLLGHMHLSDHTRSHAADLTPGVYHFFSQFCPWLEIAIESVNTSRVFSGAVAVELEACNDVNEAIRAIARTSRWIDACRKRLEEKKKAISPTADPQVLNGVLLAIDIGNSTATFFSRENDSVVARGSELEQMVGKICQEILLRRGSVLSFTGDGVIAFFQETHYAPKSEMFKFALNAAQEIRAIVDQVTAARRTQLEAVSPDQPVPRRITLRAALHQGRVYMPATRHLRHQAIGRDVVISTRLLDWISKTIEPAVPEDDRGIIIAMTKSFHRNLPPDLATIFVRWGEVEFRGIGKQEVWLDKAYVLPPRA